MLAAEIVTPGGDLVAPAIGVGVFSMLVALFTLLMRAILRTSDRADERSDAEIERLRKDLAAKEAEAEFWRDKALSLLEGRE